MSPRSMTDSEMHLLLELSEGGLDELADEFGIGTARAQLATSPKDSTEKRKHS